MPPSLRNVLSASCGRFWRYLAMFVSDGRMRPALAGVGFAPVSFAAFAVGELESSWSGKLAGAETGEISDWIA